MDLKDIQKQLLKEKNPIKYLEELLKKTKDKKLIEQIKTLIEKLKSLQRQPTRNLENIIRRAPRIPIEEPEEQPRRIQTTVTRATPSIALEVPKKQQEDYGIKTGKADYDASTEKVKRDLQQSHLVSEHGFTSGAETKQVIDKKMERIGEYSTQGGFKDGDKPKYLEHKEEFQHTQKNTTGLTALEKEIKDKKKALDYK